MPRFHSATPLPDGYVLVAGGEYYCDSEFGFCFATSAAEVYNAASGSWKIGNPMTAVRQNHTVTLLPRAQVLVTEALDPLYFYTFATTDLYQP